jgi:hypothetical protein
MGIAGTALVVPGKEQKVIEFLFKPERQDDHFFDTHPIAQGDCNPPNDAPNYTLIYG